MDPALFELIDATGGGCCRLRADETIEAASPNFLALCGLSSDEAARLGGRAPAELIPALPDLAGLPPTVAAEPVIVRVVGADGVGRELAVALHRGGSTPVLLLVDRSGEARLRRTEARLGRRIDDLQAELAVREREPRRPRIRSMAELAGRLDEALLRARRYQHQVTLVAIRVAPEQPLDGLGGGGRSVGETILGCVRLVDDLGRAAADRWLLVLPHTELAGGEVVAERVRGRLGRLGLGQIGVGVAQVGPAEPASAALERAEQACSQAVEDGGGVLLAVALV